MEFDVGLYGDGKRKAAWARMRKAQEKLGNNDPLGTWIDTDDFITKDHKHAKDNIHYLGEMPVKLGQRLCKAALKQLQAPPCGRPCRDEVAGRSASPTLRTTVP